MKQLVTRIIFKWGALLGLTLSAVEWLKLIAEKVDYPIGKLTDILVVLIIIFFIYLGIKEVRERRYFGFISFPKAFAIGSLISLVAAFVFFGYTNIHYLYIDKGGIEKRHEKAKEKFIQQSLNDTITTAELHFVLDTTSLLLHQHITHYKATSQIDSSQYNDIDSLINQIDYVFKERLTASQKVDSVHFIVKNFIPYSAYTLSNILELMLTNSDADSMTLSLLPTSVLNTKSIIESIDISQRRLTVFESNRPTANLNNPLPLALTNFILYLLFGFFLSIFVALYLSKSKDNKTTTTDDDNNNQEEDNQQEVN